MIELKGKPVADFIYQQITSELQSWKSSGWSLPHLAVILVGADPASQVYVQHKQKACEKLGFKSSLVQLAENITEKDLTEKIKQLNSDSSIDGILMQLPLPTHLDAKKFSDLIAKEKDADALTSSSLGLLVTGQQIIASCTPFGIIEMLDFYKLNVAKKNVLVIGRSLIVGLPLFHLLTQKNATVTLAHSQTVDLKSRLKEFDFVFVAIGKPEYFKPTDFKKDAVVIDVGIHRLENGLVGDVSSAGAAEHLSAFTPVPGGVGPTTIALLMRNTFKLAEKNRKFAT
ncbi:MAG: bifunctional 5,10-methylenetetrahydrofolate dehydrogenase/5,10-methenyltetrahydrofolate cyclohydrolase [Bdellovibrio sp.]|nr:bifunctional 5,10-methylenetetrahydrofolate dehydrogenase/5,10-methenyltetrahydrofolate cyclohydrolase [Bdellovibrio sp.]